MHLILEETDPKNREKVIGQLTGRLRTMGEVIDPDELNAPAWWHGDEEAFEATSAMLNTLPGRQR